MRLLALAAFNTVRRNWLFVLAIMMTFMLFGMRLNQVHAQNSSMSTGSSTKDCNTNAVIYCGVSSAADLENKFVKGDGKNTVASTRVVYSYFGIPDNDILNFSQQDVRTGEVSSNGNVTVDGRVVATDAMTAGRDYMSGSTKHTVDGTTFYTRPPSVSFASSPLAAFVVMNNGRFSFAVLMSCGNPVSATPSAPKTTPPVKPAPTPTPPPAPTKTVKPRTVTKVCSGKTTNTATSSTASQGGNCSTNTTIVQQPPVATPSAPTPPPAPTAPPSSAQCTSLQITPNVGNSETVTATALVSLQGSAAVSNVSFNWGDGTTTDNGSNLSATHSYAQAGTFTVTATITFSGGSTASSVNASVQSGANAAAGNTTAVATGSNVNASMASSTQNSPQTASCQGSASPTAPAPPAQTQPTQSPATTSSAPTSAQAPLVNTGPGQVVGIFALTSVWGAVGYRWYLTRQLLKQ